MLIPKKNRLLVYKYLFQEGVLFAKKDFNAPKHPVLDVPNLHVIKLMPWRCGTRRAGGGERSRQEQEHTVESITGQRVTLTPWRGSSAGSKGKNKSCLPGHSCHYACMEARGWRRVWRRRCAPKYPRMHPPHLNS